MESPNLTLDDENSLKNECLDRISNLPDTILGQILFYLPIKSAVATSILCTKWRYIFPFGAPPINLDLDDSFLLHPVENQSKSPSISFMNFVDKLLNETLFDVPCVDKLDLKCDKHYSDVKIVSWVLSTLQRNVQQLTFSFFLNVSEALFHTLNGCKTLVRMELGKRFDLYLPGSFTLPNLERLTLIELIFHKKCDSVNEFIEGCPSLTSLSLSGCDTTNLDFLYIDSPILTDLFIDYCWMESDCGLIVFAPNLEVLMYNDSTAVHYTLSKFKSLLLVSLYVGPTSEQLEDVDYIDEEGVSNFDSGVVKVFIACSSTVDLHLAARAIEALQRAHVEVPAFRNLTFLALGCLTIQGWKLLASLLSSAPNLETLQLEEGVHEYKEGFATFESSLPTLPVCLELKLQKINFWVVKGGEDEMKLIEYFLKNGKVLEILHVHYHPYHDTKTLFSLLRLYTFPRQSNTCEVQLLRKQPLSIPTQLSGVQIKS